MQRRRARQDHLGREEGTARQFTIDDAAAVTMFRQALDLRYRTRSRLMHVRTSESSHHPDPRHRRRILTLR